MSFLIKPRAIQPLLLHRLQRLNNDGVVENALPRRKCDRRRLLNEDQLLLYSAICNNEDLSPFVRKAFTSGTTSPIKFPPTFPLSFSYFPHYFFRKIVGKILIFSFIFFFPSYFSCHPN